MLITYTRNAMRLAKYEIPEDGQYYGEIPEFQDVWAQRKTLKPELQSAFEDWLILGFQMGHEIPVIEGIHLAPTAA